MAYLVLSNGRVFEGERFGAETDCTGELVFTTTAGSYVETLTDPCYKGQIIMQTFPLIGNYGWTGDIEGDTCHAAGYVVREWCDAPSNFRCKADLDAYLKAQGVPGICGVDTRELTQIIREEGVMAAVISSTPDVDMDALRAFAVKNAVSATAVTTSDIYPAEGEAKYSVAVMDYGCGSSVIPALCAAGCQVRVLPWGVGAEEILTAAPDGLVVTDGPGNPADNTADIAAIKAIAGKLPVFGLGLGHQMLALAMGGTVSKLKFGHRGANQPVKDVSTGKILITNQNHGYAVDSGSVTGASVSHFNLNDSTCEGLVYENIKALSVQFKPDKAQLEQFIEQFSALMGGND